MSGDRLSGGGLLARLRSSLRSLARAPIRTWVCALSVCVACASPEHERGVGKAFATPEEAARALVGAVRAGDVAALDAILGAGNSDVYDSGDEVADKAILRRFLDVYAEKNHIERRSDDEAVLCVGAVDWPFPIPIVKASGGWVFDTEGGRQEIIDRRIGKNELSAIEVCLAFVDAEKEYVQTDWDGDGILEYAQKAWSAPGKKDGLFWEAAENEPRSPLGPLAARAAAEGYEVGATRGDKQPFHGYFYRGLVRQGTHAAGGAYEYVVRGNMIGGCALVAWPAEYGVSGIVTFTVNHDGTVFQKDLGDDTERLVREMQAFDPDATWKKAKT